MLATSPSPGLHASPHNNRSSSSESLRSPYEVVRKSSHTNSPISRPRSSHVYAAPQPTQPAPPCPPHRPLEVNAATTSTSPSTNRRKMVDVGTQYSPPSDYVSPSTTKKPPVTQVAQLNLAESNKEPTAPKPSTPVEPVIKPVDTHTQSRIVEPSPAKRHASDSAQSIQSQSQHPESPSRQDQDQDQDKEQSATTKRPRPEDQPMKIMPVDYEGCDTRDLVILISSMLMELIRYNDAIPLRDGALTRFHSRAPPTISVIDYLQRLTTHATLSAPILLSMVYYIDKLCALYPAFTISSLTVHRFLITAATVASKGLSDSFWTNKTYARVGGVTVRELALLELEFLVRVQWRIVPKPEVLVDYYGRLVERSPGYEIEQTDSTMTGESEPSN